MKLNRSIFASWHSGFTPYPFSRVFSTCTVSDFFVLLHIKNFRNQGAPSLVENFVASISSWRIIHSSSASLCTFCIVSNNIFSCSHVGEYSQILQTLYISIIIKDNSQEDVTSLHHMEGIQFNTPHMRAGLLSLRTKHIFFLDTY